MDDSQSHNKLSWVDNLRVLATFSVVLLHVAASALYGYGKHSETDWLIANGFDGIVRFCVPIFVMLTGALVLTKEYELKDFLKKRLFRIVVPFVFWSVIYLFYHLFLVFRSKATFEIGELFFFVLDKIKHGASFHLWYVYMIIGVYLFIPILGKWIRSATDKELLYFLSIWTITLFLNLPGLSVIKTDLDLSYFSGYIGYLVLGYFLAERASNLTVSNMKLTLLFLLGVFITIIGTYFLTHQDGKLNNSFYNYLTPNVAISSICVFLFVRKLNLSNSYWIKTRDFISKYSFGIYLGHVLVLFFLDKAGISWGLIHPIVGVPVTTILCLSLTAVVIYGINKFMPFGKFISG